uniref:Venom dipeptidyl peptidase 4 n=2 Tax=Lepeophtheirus salmonis TaxID=72036 RepID=A0A0K2UIH4_LEPSM
MIKYPKAGTKNPIVTLKVYDILKSKTLLVNPPPEVEAYGDYIFTATTWITDDKLSIIWMNRQQTKSVISECQENNDQKYDCKQRYMVEEEKGWVDLFQPPIYSNDGTEFLQIRPPPPTKENDLRYNHIFHSEKQQLTSGNFVVVSILHWKDSLIYFIGTRPGYPGERHLYSVSLDKDIRCITCSTECQYISASFGESMYIQKCSSPIKIPVVTLRKIKNHELIATIEDNSELKEILADKALPKRRDLMEPVGEDKKFYAPVSLLLPLDFDENKKYPTLVYVYGGPGSQEVSYAWNSPAWPEYLVTSRNIIYMTIDGRGTGFQSVDYQFANYHALGTLEIQDQIQVTQSIQKKFSFIDKKRTGIWGWSYGGYVTLMALIQDKKKVFSCGISVAPPTDWLFYDSVYTERYMGLPTSEKNGGNKRGYERASVLRSVEALRNKTLLINHGTADDNVHYQQSMMLIREMEQRNIDFEEFTYPDENHALGGVSQFLYHHMDKFLGKCFGYKV